MSYILSWYVKLSLLHLVLLNSKMGFLDISNHSPANLIQNKNMNIKQINTYLIVRFWWSNQVMWTNQRAFEIALKLDLWTTA